MELRTKRRDATNIAKRALDRFDYTARKDLSDALTETLIRGMYGYWRKVMEA